MLTPRVPSSSLYRLANDRMGGRLAERIAELRARNEPWAAIAIALHDESGGMRISHETLRQWATTLAATQLAPADAPSAEAVGQ